MYSSNKSICFSPCGCLARLYCISSIHPPTGWRHRAWSGWAVRLRTTSPDLAGWNTHIPPFFPGHRVEREPLYYPHLAEVHSMWKIQEWRQRECHVILAEPSGFVLQWEVSAKDSLAAVRRWYILGCNDFANRAKLTFLCLFCFIGVVAQWFSKGPINIMETGYTGICLLWSCVQEVTTHIYSPINS